MVIDIMITTDWRHWRPSSVEVNVLILTLSQRCELSYAPSLRSLRFDFALPAGRSLTEAASAHPSHPWRKQNRSIDHYGNVNVLGFLCAFNDKRTPSGAVLIFFLFLSLCSAWNWLEEEKGRTGSVLRLMSPARFWNQSFTSLKEPGKTLIDFHSFSNRQHSIDS